MGEILLYDETKQNLYQLEDFGLGISEYGFWSHGQRYLKSELGIWD